MLQHLLLEVMFFWGKQEKVFLPIVLMNACDLTSAELSSFWQMTTADKKMGFFSAFLSSLQESNADQGDQTD